MDLSRDAGPKAPPPHDDTLSGHKQQVPHEFDRVARGYDLMCALNPGYARHLRWSARRLDLPREARILDLCCGTGLSTRALVDTYPDADITGVDASPGMLEEARKKPALGRVRFVEGNAMDPAAAAPGPFDGILMAYGIRNMPDRDTCLRRVMGLLAPGGRICFHEYSVAGAPVPRAVWHAVSFGVILPIGLAVTRTTSIFRYLHRSVTAFDSVAAFEDRLRRAGFVDVVTLPMNGWQRGIVHSFLARRPV